VELDALERWGVGQRLLDGVVSGLDGRAAIRAEIASGKLPPGQLGKPVVDEIWGVVDDIARQAGALVTGEARSVDVKLEVAGRRLTGTVPGVRGSVLATITYSKVNPRHRIGAWVRLLALCATGEAYASATIGRGSGPQASVTVARVPALARSEALAELAVLVDLYERGMREPLPLFCRTSAAYAAGANAGAEWQSDRFPKEDREPEHELVYGPGMPYASLLEAAPRDDERWDPVERTRFGQYALRLWRGLLAVETQ
jgi:exodeoxyribonuclease V gamma subunit